MNYEINYNFTMALAVNAFYCLQILKYVLLFIKIIFIMF